MYKNGWNVVKCEKNDENIVEKCLLVVYLKIIIIEMWSLIN